MPTWNAELYLQFADERTRPCRELAARVAIDAPRRVVDLGCGPGNSTQAVGQRWPTAAIVGIDASPEMIAAARRSNPNGQFHLRDIADWATNGDESPDVVFSNAALQWVPDHAALFPRLLKQVAAGGALAVQVPANVHAPAHRLMRELAASALWRARFPIGGVREWNAHSPAFYYDALAPQAVRIDLWTTEYIQIMPSAEAIVDWYRGSGLRPYLEALGGDAERQRFASEYLSAIRGAYPPQPNGQVLFPFQRLFVIAYR
ncbi:MAG: trans-aconitate 2-methyltransferase [Pirellulales bacterium]|nr:trans-aconitate 2-methyltransferase [Pirellulales bacterium]